RADAERALRENGQIGESYITLSVIEPTRNYADRENLLQQALARDELNGTVNNFYSDLLREMGRDSEALAYARHGLALDPLSTSKRRGLAYLLQLTGDDATARDLVESMAPAWPEHPRLWRARMHVALWSGRFAEALALLDAPGSTARSGEAKA